MAKAGDKFGRFNRTWRLVGLVTRPDGSQTWQYLPVGVSPVAPTKKQHRVVEAPQGSRLQIKLNELFGDRMPSEKELSNGELVVMVVRAFKDDPKAKKTGLRIPDRKTILHHAGRIKRKK